MRTARHAVQFLLAIALLTSSAFAQTPTESFAGQEAAMRQIIAKFNGPLGQQDLNNLVRNFDLDVARPVGPDDGTYLFRSTGRNIEDLIRGFLNHPRIQFAEPNYLLRRTVTPNDTSFDNLWGLKNTGQNISGSGVGTPGADIEAENAWDISTGSSNIVVGVIDTGIDYNHPDLAPNMWTAPTAFSVVIGGLTINCAAGTRGFNAINNTCNPLDDEDHGTHVAGTIGAKGNNGIGITGVNWDVRLMGLKFLDSTGNGFTSDAVDAINFAIQVKQIFGAAANIRVLNNSWGGGGFSSTLLSAINSSNAADMLFVAAAGNNTSNNDVFPQYPASYTAPNVLAVAATTNTEGLAWFSNYGATSVDLGAPGQSIYSTIRNNQYFFFSGTSMASPHVAGAAALVLSVCNLTTAQLKANLMNNVELIPSLAGRTVTGGRLNVYRSITNCTATPDFTISAAPASRTVTPGTSTTYTVTVGSLGGFNGAVGLTVSGLPAGATGTFAPASISGGAGTSTLTVTTSGSTPGGTSNVTVTGTSGSLVHSASVSLVVNVPQPNFSVSVTPASQSISSGGSTSFTVNIASIAGFTGTVALSASGLPAGATGTFTPTSVSGGSGTSTLNITTTGSTPTGTFTVTVTGTSGSLVRTGSAVLVITGAAPNFTLNITPATRTTLPGMSTTYTVTVIPSGGFNGTVSFTIYPMAGVASFQPPTVTGAGSTTLTINVPANIVPPKSFSATVTGTSGSLVRTATLALNVVAALPDFTLSSAPATQTIVQGFGTSFTNTITPLNGFNSTVNLSVAGLPAGATGTFSPTAVPGGSGSSTLNITTIPTVPVGTYGLTITATDGDITRTSNVSLTIVVPPDFTISAAPALQTVTAGGSTTFTATINSTGGFSNNVNLLVTGLPSGANGSFSPSTIAGGTGSATLAVSTSGSTPAGSYTLTIAATDGTLTRTATVTLSVQVSSGTPTFTLSITPAAQTVSPGQSAFYTVTVTPANGFTGNVTLTIYPMTGVASFTPNPITGGTGTATLQINVPSNLSVPRSYNVQVTGTSGSIVKNTTFVLNVN